MEKYVKKGTLVYIEGKIQSRSWEDKGVKKYATDIIAKELQLLSKKEQSGGQQASDPYVTGARQMQTQQTTPIPTVSENDNPEDDLPF